MGYVSRLVLPAPAEPSQTFAGAPARGLYSSLPSGILTSGGEVKGDASRALTEDQARRSLAVLVLEPGTGLAGKLKTGRKGVGVYRLAVTGQAAHAGVDFSAGASAILELARQLGKIAGFTNLKRGLTVKPGLISGGTRSNVVAAQAAPEIDMRVVRLKDFGGVGEGAHAPNESILTDRIADRTALIAKLLGGI